MIWGRDREGGAGSRREEGLEYRFFAGRGDDRVADALRRLPSPTPAFASALYYPAYHLALARDARRLRPDVIHVHNFSQLVPLLHAASPRSSFVLHMHCEWLNQLDRRLIRRRLRHADLVLGCSDFISSRIATAFPELRSRVQTLFEGVALDEFRPEERRLPRESVRLLSVGRISPEKGTHALFEAFARVASRRPELELEVLGVEALPPPEMLVELDELPRVRALASYYERGGYLDDLKRALPAEALERISLRGFVPHAEAPRRFRDADVLVFPSVWSEPFGMPTAEAMAAGLPVLATRVGGIPEVVEDGVTGLLVKPADAIALAEAIERLVADPDLRRRLGDAGRRRAAERFGWDELTEQTLALYRALR